MLSANWTIFLYNRSTNTFVIIFKLFYHRTYESHSLKSYPICQKNTLGRWIFSSHPLAGVSEGSFWTPSVLCLVWHVKMSPVKRAFRPNRSEAVCYSERKPGLVCHMLQTGCYVVSLEGATGMMTSLMWWCSSKVWSWMSASHVYLLTRSNTWKMLITRRCCGVDYLQALQRTPPPRPATGLCIILYPVQVKLKSLSIITDRTPVLLQICPSELSGCLSAPQRCLLY